MDELKIVYRNIDELIPYENNPRQNDEAVEYVANSIKEFGFKVPIIIDKDNIIVTGHTRLKAAKKLGLEQVPTIQANDLNEKQIKAFRLADNKVSDYSIWDNKKLLQELDELNFEIFTGFEKSDFFDDIKDIGELIETDKEIMENNEEGIVYTVTFKTQNKNLVEEIRRRLDEE